MSAHRVIHTPIFSEVQFARMHLKSVIIAETAEKLQILKHKDYILFVEMAVQVEYNCF